MNKWTITPAAAETISQIEEAFSLGMESQVAPSPASSTMHYVFIGNERGNVFRYLIRADGKIHSVECRANESWNAHWIPDLDPIRNRIGGENSVFAQTQS